MKNGNKMGLSIIVEDRIPAAPAIQHNMMQTMFMLSNYAGKKVKAVFIVP